MIDLGTLQDIYTVGKKIYDIVQSIKSAPKAVLDLQGQVELVQGVLEALQGELEGRDNAELDDWSTAAFLKRLDEALQLMKEADKLLEKVTEKEKSNKIVRSVKWVIFNESDVKALAERFQKFYGSLCVVQGTLQLRLFRDSLKIRQDGREEVNVSLQTIIQISQLIQRRTEEISEKVDTLHKLSASNSQSIYQVCGRSSKPLLTTSSSRTCHDWGTQIHTVDDVAVSCTTGFSGSPAYHSGHCGPKCKCQCHTTPILIVPLVLNSLLGRSQPRVECNEATCKRLQRMTFSVLRAFRQVTAEVWIEGQSLTHVTLRMPRVVGKNGLVWLHTATLDEVRQKLASRELTVNDVHPNGQTVLSAVSIRLTADRSDAALSIAAFLTEHSAPTDWEWNGLTPTELALWWSLVLWRWYESRDAAFNALRFRLAPYLPQDIDDAHEGLSTKMRWSGLHRFFCRLSSPDLTSTPPDLISQVNVRDIKGRTPLFYAMIVGPEDMHALLRAGANPRIGFDILIFAARAGADTAISTLVRTGAYINASDHQDMTALDWVVQPNLVYSINGLLVALELIRHAGHLLNWQIRHKYGRTPLDLAQSRARRNPDDEDSQRILELYRTRRLPDGAQYLPTLCTVDAKDEAAKDDISGLPPTSLIRAGLRGDIEVIGELIHRGAMVNERDGNGRTLLHLVALGIVPHGYRIALELVRHGGWGVDWEALVTEDKPEDGDKNTDGDGVDDGDEAEGKNNSGEAKDDENEDEVWDGRGVGWTPLEIAEARLKHDALAAQERNELEKVRDLLKAQRLPPDEEYLWPCMDPDFYARMPGAWE